jgi:large subunit ribosomal protein L13
MNKTYSAKPSDITREWILFDAKDVPIGRLSTEISIALTGKNKPFFTAHIDCGDNVIVINADKIAATGNKLLGKKYYRHSGFPGGIKESTLKDKMEKDPTFAITNAVKGMLPKNKLQNERMKRLRVFIGENHDHVAQKPRKIEVKR